MPLMDEDTKRFLDGVLTRRDAEMKRYLDGLLERHVTITQAMIGSIAKMEAEMQAGFAALQAEIADQREQIKANTAATWAMLDRFGPEPQG